MPNPGFFDKWSVAVSSEAAGDVQVLAFSVEPQQRRNWCWAAVTASVSRFYNPGSSWTQCGLADIELGRTDCCSGGPCDIPWRLSRSLTRTGNLRWVREESLAVGLVSEQVQGGNPVACRIAWQGGGGHFVVAYGITIVGTADAFVHVADPAQGISKVAYEVFRGEYLGSGIWTHSYGLKPPGEA